MEYFEEFNKNNNNSSTADDDRRHSGVEVCTQHVGDIFIVPDNFGHVRGGVCDGV